MEEENDEFEGLNFPPSLRWIFGIGGAALLVFALIFAWRDQEEDDQTKAGPMVIWNNPKISRSKGNLRIARRGAGLEAQLTAEEVVAQKQSQFAANRLALAERMAKHFNIEMPDEVRQFFAAVETGQWEEVEARFKVISQWRQQEGAPQLGPLWQPILEA